MPRFETGKGISDTVIGGDVTVKSAGYTAKGADDSYKESLP